MFPLLPIYFFSCWLVALHTLSLDNSQGRAQWSSVLELVARRLKTSHAEKDRKRRFMETIVEHSSASQQTVCTFWQSFFLSTVFSQKKVCARKSKLVNCAKWTVITGRQSATSKAENDFYILG